MEIHQPASLPQSTFRITECSTPQAFPSKISTGIGVGKMLTVASTVQMWYYHALRSCLDIFIVIRSFTHLFSQPFFTEHLLGIFYTAS